MTQPINTSDIIKLESTSIVKVSQEGVVIKKVENNEYKTQHYLYPSNEEIYWDIDAEYLAGIKPEDKVLLLLQVQI